MVVGDSFFDIAVGEVTYFQVKGFYYGLVSKRVGGTADGSFRELLLGFSSYATVVGNI
jgi:hypothetical protein